jgi:hypothetical protein
MATTDLPGIASRAMSKAQFEKEAQFEQELFAARRAVTPDPGLRVNALDQAIRVSLAQYPATEGTEVVVARAKAYEAFLTRTSD